MEEVVLERPGMFATAMKYKVWILIVIIFILGFVATDKIGWGWIIVSIIAVGIVLVIIDKRRTAKRQGLDQNINEIAKEASEAYYKTHCIRLDYTDIDACELTPGSKQWGLDFKANRVLLEYNALLKYIVTIWKWSYTLPERQYYAEKSKIWEIISKKITDEELKTLRENPGIITS